MTDEELLTRLDELVATRGAAPTRSWHSERLDPKRDAHVLGVMRDRWACRGER